MQRNALLILLLSLFRPAIAAAQVSPLDGCNIRYQYDAAGNRIQRDWYCSGVVKSLHEPADTVAGPLASAHLKVQPNPASDRMDVLLSSDVQGGMLMVVDGSGRQVTSQALRDASAWLDVSAFSPGLYYLIYTLADERIVTMFSVSH